MIWYWCCLTFKIYFVRSKRVTKTFLEVVHYIDNFALMQLIHAIKHLFSLLVWFVKELLEQTINISLSLSPSPCNFDTLKSCFKMLIWLSNIFWKLFFIISRSHLKRLLGIDNLLTTLYTLIFHSIAVFLIANLASSTFGRPTLAVSYLRPAE